MLIITPTLCKHRMGYEWRVFQKEASVDALKEERRCDIYMPYDADIGIKFRVSTHCSISR